MDYCMICTVFGQMQNFVKVNPSLKDYIIK
jgi:hypothetical protein